MKAGALSRVLGGMRAPELTCVTRWFPGELAAGVSDLGTYEIVKARGGRLLLRQDLHAKYYRADHRVLVGSANITHAALGWSVQPNLELLVEHGADAHGFLAFEEGLVRSAILVDEELHSMVVSAVAGISVELEVGERYERFTLDRTPADLRSWVPSLRQPTELYRTYENAEDDSIATIARDAALADLAVLRPPAGLDLAAFERAIAATLLTLPVIEAIDRYAAEPRPFGVVRSLLQERLRCDRETAEGALQTLIRWLLHFHPDRYQYQRPAHSEIFCRR